MMVEAIHDACFELCLPNLIRRHLSFIENLHSLKLILHLIISCPYCGLSTLAQITLRKNVAILELWQLVPLLYSLESVREVPDR